MRQILVDFGTVELFGRGIPLRVYGYGLMLVLGFALGIFLARWRARRAGEDPDVLTWCGVLGLVAGVAGARAAFVVENWRAFAASPHGLADVLDVSSGGLIYYGGVLLAAPVVLVYLRWKRLPVRRYLDILAASLMVGLAFGRAGCLLNGCCWGGPCRHDWPLAARFPMYSRPLLKLDGRVNPYSEATVWPSPVYAAQVASGRVRVPEGLRDAEGYLVPPAAFTPEQVRLAEEARSAPVKPAQLLGLANALLLAGVLTAFHRLRSREGQVFALLAVLYPITRFILESVRADNPRRFLRGELTHNQYTSLALLAAGVAMMLALRKMPASAGPLLAERRRGAETARQRGT